MWIFALAAKVTAEDDTISSCASLWLDCCWVRGGEPGCGAATDFVIQVLLELPVLLHFPRVFKGVHPPPPRAGARPPHQGWVHHDPLTPVPTTAGRMHSSGIIMDSLGASFLIISKLKSSFQVRFPSPSSC